MPTGLSCTQKERGISLIPRHRQAISLTQFCVPMQNRAGVFGDKQQRLYATLLFFCNNLRRAIILFVDVVQNMHAARQRAALIGVHAKLDQVANCEPGGGRHL